MPRYKLSLLAAVMSLTVLFGDQAANFANETLERLGLTSTPRVWGEASAQEDPDDDGEDDEGEAGGDGEADDPGDDGAGDDDAGAGDDDAAGGDDDGAAGDDDDGAAGDDDDGAAGDDDDGAAGDDDDGAAGGDDDDSGAGGDDDDGAAGGDDDDSGAGGDDDDGAAGGDDDDGAAGGDDDDGAAGGDDNAPPGGDDDDGAAGGGDDDGAAGGDDEPGALPEGVDVDFEGQWIKTGEILALEADPTSLDLARELGFQVIERHRLTTLGMSIVELRVPSGQVTREALAALRRGDPDTAYDFNHFYSPSQNTTNAARVQSGQRASSNTAGATIGIVDSAVDMSHPGLSGVRIEQVSFVGPDTPVEHGTAVASVLASNNANHQLLVAGVVERQARGGLASADALVRALDWLARNRAPVANISLAGPPNAMVGDAIQRAQAQGMIIVAAVGNDGPAAPPLYPASYDGVVGVTAVDQSGGVYRRAGRGSQVDVAALGVGVRVAAPGGGYVEASGTSYAAPLIAAALAQRHGAPNADAARNAVQQLMRNAADAGEPGHDPVYGAGVISGGRSQ